MSSIWLEGSIRHQRFDQNYRIEDDQIGVKLKSKSVMCTVHKCVSRFSEQVFVVKVIHKKNGERRKYRNVEKLLCVKHSNLLRIREIYETVDEIRVVNEFSTGLRAFEWFANHDEYSEFDVAACIHDVLSALQRLHDFDIVHGNLKPENMYVTGDVEHLKTEIGDYGKHLIVGGATCRLVNVWSSANYTAPEILCGYPLEKPVDMWSVGALTYTILTGFEPFHSNSVLETYKRVLNCFPVYDQHYWNEITENAKDFVKHLLVRDPHARMTVSQALRHPWLNGAASEYRLLTSPPSSIKYVNKRRLLKLASETPKVIRAQDMAELFPIHIPTRDLYHESSEYSVWPSLTDVFLGPVEVAFANSATRAALAAADPLDGLSHVPRDDMFEGQEVQHPLTQHSISALSTTTRLPPVGYELMMLSLDVSSDCSRTFADLFRRRASSIPGHGLVFEDTLPVAAPSDLGAADHSETVRGGWDGEVRDLFQWAWSDDVIPIPIGMNEQQTSLALHTSIIDLPAGRQQLQGDTMWNTSADFSQLVNDQ